MCKRLGTPWLLLLAIGVVSPLKAQSGDQREESASPAARQPGARQPVAATHVPSGGDSEEAAELDAESFRAKAEAVKRRQYEVAEQLRRRFPDDFEALRIMGFVHSSHGAHQAMLDCWNRCRQLQPTRPDIYVQLARHAQDTEQHQQAISLFKTALRLEDDQPRVRQWLASSLLNLGQADEAVTWLETEVERYPNNAQAHFLLGDAYFQQGAFQQAAEQYQAATKIRPDHAQAVYGLFKSNTRMRNMQAAAKYAKRFQELEEKAAAADQEARKRYDDLQQMKKNLAQTCFEAGRRYAQDGMQQTAVKLWQEAARVDEDHAGAHRVLASLLIRREQFRPALYHLTHLARLNPDQPDYFRRIGFLLARLGRIEQAEAAFAQMIRIAPQDARGYHSLAKFYLNIDRSSDRALKLARRAMKLSQSAESYFVWGWAESKVGDLRVAKRALQEALTKDPNNRIYRQLYDQVQRRQQERIETGPADQ